MVSYNNFSDEKKASLGNVTNTYQLWFYNSKQKCRTLRSISAVLLGKLLSPEQQENCQVFYSQEKANKIKILVVKRGFLEVRFLLFIASYLETIYYIYIFLVILENFITLLVVIYACQE